MKIIVGLGNPERKYTNTRHNVGFMVIDALGSKLGVKNYELSKKFNSLIFNNQQLILIKPQTFMNESGVAVSSIANFYKIPVSDICVIHDDLDVKLGEYKIQKGVGPKVHNGVNSIEEKLGNDDFWRVRVGVENRVGDRIPGEDYVLQKFTDDEKPKLEEVIKKILIELESKYNF